MSAVVALTIAAFFAGFIDSMAGGGGLISLPAILAAGINPHLALGTNKVQSFLGTTFSTLRYFKSGQLYLPVAAYSAVAALVGSYAGSRAVLVIPSQSLEVIILPLLVMVGLVTVLKKQFGMEDRFVHGGARTSILAAVIGLVIGFYDGFFGPGTGTFLTFAFVSAFRFGFLRASAAAKLTNLASNAAAVLAFATARSIIWTVALPMAIANIAGNWLGAGLAIKGGSRLVKVVFAVALVGLIVKQIWFK